MSQVQMQIAQGFRILAVLLCTFLAGCGGGSKGTGGDELYGKVLFRDAQPAANVEVTTLSSGDSATTDENGDFRIEADLPAGDLPLGIDTKVFSSTVTIAGLPAGESSIRCVIELDSAAQAARVTEVTIGSRHTPTPTPTKRPPATPSPERTAKPTSSASATPTPVPQGTGTVTPSPTNSESPTPSPTPEEEEGEDVEKSGTITVKSGVTIVVRGVTFVVDEHTTIHGQQVHSFGDLAVGMLVQVHGYDDHTRVVAHEIEVLESEHEAD